MQKKKWLLIFLTFMLIIFIISVITAMAAANTVPVTHMTDQTNGIAIWELAPPECSNIRAGLTAILVCPPDCNGNGNDNELILGSSGNDIIDGKNGDDCIIGGDGNDNLIGSNGDDVLIGGSGSDTLDGGQRKKDGNTCIDDPATTIFINCN